MPSSRPRILLLQDAGPTRAALGVVLRGSGYQVLEVPDGLTLAEHLDAYRPDLVILDRHFAVGPDGCELARLLRLRSDLPVIFVTGAGSVADRLAGFAAGADDYLVRPYATAELLARLAALLRRSGRLLSPVWQVGDLLVDDNARSVTRAGQPVELTRTEYDLLTVLAQHVGTVQSKPRLLAQVWGLGAYDTNLVEVHMSALRRKLEAAGPRIIATIRGDGYLLLAPR